MILETINHTKRGVHKVVKLALKVLQYILKDFEVVLDHFVDNRCYSVKINEAINMKYVKYPRHSQ